MERKDSELTAELLRFMLPEYIYDNFEVVGLKEVAGRIEIQLEEKELEPIDTQGKKYHSKGFTKKTIQDFPLRGRQVLLDLKIRKWVDVETGEIYKRNWDDLCIPGTKYSKEFAEFLKKVVGI